MYRIITVPQHTLGRSIAYLVKKKLALLVFPPLLLAAFFWLRPTNALAQFSTCNPGSPFASVCQVNVSGFPVYWGGSQFVSWTSYNQHNRQVLLWRCAGLSNNPVCVERAIRDWEANNTPNLQWQIPSCIRPGQYWIYVAVQDGRGSTDAEVSANSFVIQSNGLPCVYSVSLDRTAQELGKPTRITWSKENQRAYQIDLLDSSDQPVNTIVPRTNSSATTSKSWTVPTDLAAGTYSIRVQLWNAQNATHSEQSEPFTLTEPAPTIRNLRLTPSTVEQGAQETITWDSTFQHAYQVDLCRSSNQCTTIINRTDSTEPNTNWQVPQEQTLGSHSLQVTIWNRAGVSAKRSLSINVLEGPPLLNSISVSATSIPQGGELTITWDGLRQKSLQIDLQRCSGQRIRTLLSKHANADSSYLWQVPDDLATGDYAVQVQLWNGRNQTVSGASSCIAVSEAAPVIDQINIDPDELFPGERQTISWSATRQRAIQLDLVTGSGQQVQAILARRNSSATNHAWTVPANLSPGSYAIQLQIWNAAGLVATARSAPFTVNGPPTVSNVLVQHPQVSQGEEQSVSWRSLHQHFLQIDLLTPAGRLHSTILPRQQSNALRHSWIVPASLPPDTYSVNVRIWGQTSGGDAQRSNSFAVTQPDPGPAVESIAVNPMTVLPGESQTVSWVTRNQHAFQLDLLDASLQLVRSIVGRQTSDLTEHTWTIPDDLPHGTYQVQLQVWNVAGESASAQSSAFLVSQGNRKPVPADDVATTNLNTPVRIPVLDNDSDPDGDPLTIIDVGPPANGTATTHGTTVTYTPNRRFNGPDNFDYTVSDGTASATATVQVTVGSRSSSPILNSDGDAFLTSISQGETDNAGTTVSELIKSVEPLDMIQCCGRARLRDGLAIITVDNSNGMWQYQVERRGTWFEFGTPSPDAARLLLADRIASIRFVPNPGFAGKVDEGIVFKAWKISSYGNGAVADTVADPASFSANTESASITVTPVEPPPNSPPVPAADIVTTEEDVPVVIDVLSNDVDPDGDRLSFSHVSLLPAHGTVTVEGSQLRYAPASNYHGQDTLQYIVSDGRDSSSADVFISITSINDPPVAVDDAVRVLEDGSILFDPLANDSDPDDELTGLTIVTPPKLGHAIVENNQIRYTPLADEFGSDSMIYQISGGHSTIEGCVTLVIDPVNDAPEFTKGADQSVIVNGGPETVAGWAANLSAGPVNENAQQLRFELNVDNPALFARQPAIDRAGTLTYEPVTDAAGSVTVTTTVFDDGGTDNGGVDRSPPQQFTITIEPDFIPLPPTPPDAVDDTVSTAFETAVSIPVLANDTDIPGSSVTIANVGNPGHGTTALTGSQIRYTPASGFSGLDTFEYTIINDVKMTDTATVSVTVLEPPVLPWQDDSFDTLTLGTLCGQNGWQAAAANRACPEVIGGQNGNHLQIDAAPGATIVVGKDVADQASGQHQIELDVMVSGATEHSLAKLEVRTASGAGWDKKFQLFFGASMRVNYSPQGDAQTIVPVTEMGQWYRLRLEAHLGTEQLDVYVDDRRVTTALPMHPGAITDLSLSGWDRAGAVFIDSLRGQPGATPRSQQSQTPGIPLSPTEIVVTPSHPDSDDNVQLTVSGTWSNMCVPELASHQIVSDTIDIRTTTGEEELCAEVVTDWVFTVGLGQLPIDEYAVSASGALTGTVAFSVVGVHGAAIEFKPPCPL